MRTATIRAALLGGCLCTLAWSASLSAAKPSLQLEAVTDTGAVILSLPLKPRDSWCLLWNHSVAGFTVSDCFINKDTNLLLHASHQPDFAAGLGHWEGRGTLRNDGQGGYLITDIDEPIPDNRLHLRVGSLAVNHRIQHHGQHYSLSETVAGQRVTLRLSYQ